MEESKGKASLTATAPSYSKGRLFVRIVECTELLSRRPAESKPYCVVQFEGSEFVTKEAHYTEAKYDISKGRRNPVWKQEGVFDITTPDGEIIVTVYDRIAGSKEEDFLGYVKIRPPRLDERLQDNTFRLMPRQWKEKVAGDIRLQIVFKSAPTKSLSPDDFELLKVLGKGSFGKVVQVRKHDTHRVYAMKILYKKDIVKREEVAHTMSERNILKHTNFPFLVGLKFAFQTTDKLYLVLDYMNGGELFYHLQQSAAFGEERSKFYAAEILLALQHLHTHNVIYRDLKPENILLDSNGHVALTDFGLCKENMTPEKITKTFCGTAEYLAPEVLLGKGYNGSVDWWSLGILLFEMITGLPPFYADNHNVMYRKILYGEVEYPENLSDEGKDLISRLLDREPSKRLGATADDAEPIKKHPFFSEMNWDKLLKKELKPPFKPAVESEADTSNFDPSFLKMDVQDSPSMVDKGDMLSQSVQQEFKGFTFIEESAFNKMSGADNLKPKGPKI